MFIDSQDISRKDKIGEALKEIHRNIPVSNTNMNEINNYEIRDNFGEGKAFKRLIIYLKSSGCQWALEDENCGCTMCGLSAGTTRGRKISVKEYQTQFDQIISKIEFSSISLICIYNAGSFLNDSEVPAEARLHIYRVINSIKQIKRVIFESRPHYITGEKLEVMKKELPEKKIEIGMGLDSSDDNVRWLCLNKELTKEDFLKAVKLMKDHSIYSLAYVLLKPPFLSEAAGIEDSVSTIQWAFENGVDIVSLEPINIQEYTLLHLLYNIGEYRMPWIWSVLKVVSKLGTLKKEHALRIGGFEFFPKPSLFTSNCPECDDVCINAINDYNSTYNIEFINIALDKNCHCKDKWEKQLSENITFRQAIDNFIKKINEINITKSIRK